MAGELKRMVDTVRYDCVGGYHRVRGLCFEKYLEEEEERA
jgi:hypothetical protein